MESAVREEELSFEVRRVGITSGVWARVWEAGQRRGPGLGSRTKEMPGN